MLDTYEIPAELMARRRIAERIRGGCAEYIALLRAQRTPVRIETELARRNVVSMTDELLRGQRLELVDHVDTLVPDWLEFFIDWRAGTVAVAASPFDAVMGEMTLTPGVEYIRRDGR